MANLFRSLDPESDEVVDNAEVGTKPLSDREKVAKLEAEPKVKVYRSMQLIDGKLYPADECQGGRQTERAERAGRVGRGRREGSEQPRRG